MNQPNRDGWHPSQQPNSGSSQQQQQSQQSQQSAPSTGAPVLPPPSGLVVLSGISQSAGYAHSRPITGAFFSNPPTAHNLPGLAGLTQASQAVAGQSNQHPPAHTSDQAGASHAHQTAQQQQAHPFTGMAQHQVQPHPSIENDRERDARELEEMARREAERDREMRERQHREQQPPHENHTGSIQIHQPVAVPPNVRSIHGPNGLLGNPGPPSSNSAQGPLSTAQGLFSGGPLHQGDPNTRMQQQTQQPQAPMLVPFANQAAQQQGGGMNQAQQPILNDALSYLDQVKVQFADHPDVYNRFLDIMKDFKSGAIDTPGVIERVSHLFAGNPSLIQGFNTFLPPGYKIECGTEGDPNAIRVTTPMGTTVSTMPAARPLSAPRAPGMNGNIPNPNERGMFDGASRVVWQHQQPGGAPEAGFSPEGRAAPQAGYGAQSGPTSHPPHSPEAYREQQAAAAAAAAIHQQEQRNVTHLQNAASAASAAALTGRGGVVSSPGDAIASLQPHMLNGVSPGAQQAIANGGVEKRGPVEFNHAISYVNKIKNRFAQQPDIYKQFLEILQTYQRESKPIQDVYAQVTRLFETAPDLLEDFKQFLPESAASNQNKPAARATGEEAFPLSSTRNEPGYAAAASANSHLHQTPRPDQPRLPPMGNFAPTPSANRDSNKRKRGERQGATAAMTPSIPAEANNVGPRSGLGQTGNGNKRLKQAHAPKPAAAPDMSATSPSLVPPLPQPLPPTTTVGAAPDDIAFFDRVRKHIGNKSLFGEFLKMLNMYTGDLVSERYFVYRCQSFIGGNPELMTWLKNFLHYHKSDKSDEVVENQPKNVHGKIHLSNCRGLGPSYRMIPKVESNKKCSGRDALCNSVLNDQWVSHPTWASEDSGFVAHRKNVHEEGLHRVEEERHDYDFHIEACSRTIQLLEPIAQILSTSTPEVRRNFVLDTKLGGQSETIYRRVIFKIYGRERGNDVLGNLFERPYDVVPILLTRLKTKYQEWKAAQVQWERVWRVQTNQLFFKSLDHQGVATRVADKRQFWPKQLVNEIQVKYQEQKRQRELRQASLPAYQFSYMFHDKVVLLDAARLVVSYAEHSLSTEYPKLQSFITELLSQFFLIDPVELQESVQANGSSGEDAGDASPIPEGGVSPHHQSSRKAKDLRRTVGNATLGRGRNRVEKEGSAASDSRGTSPDVVSLADEEMVDAEPTPVAQGIGNATTAEKWFTHPTETLFSNGQTIAPNQKYQRTAYNMYCNSTMYCFMRLFGILYERLVKVKANEEEVHKTIRRALHPKAARELHWIEKTPQDFFADTSPQANYYSQMVWMFNEMAKGNAEMPQIEETLRRYYLQDGWQLYSLDKLLGSLTRFAVGMVTPDSREKTTEIYHLFRKDRQRGSETSHQDELNYRRQVDKHIKDGDVFRIAYDETTKGMYIQLFKPDDPTFEPSTLSDTDRWKVYISAYQSNEPTEGVTYIRPPQFPFLRRAMRQQWGEDQPSLDSVIADTKRSGELPFHVVTETYKPTFDPDTAELAIMTWAKGTEAEAEQESKRRETVASEAYQANSDWMKGLSKDDVDQKKQAFADAFAAEA